MKLQHLQENTSPAQQQRSHLLADFSLGPKAFAVVHLTSELAGGSPGESPSNMTGSCTVVEAIRTANTNTNTGLHI